MRKIITTTFVTLDGVMQAPGGPNEDTSGGFRYGGWQYGYGDKVQDEFLGTIMRQPFELLLGRKTYDIFAAYWPTAQTANEVAVPFNNTKKYVVSRTPQALAWQHSTLVTGDVVAELRSLKAADAPDLHVWGSGNLIQTLLNNDLIDRMHILTYPLIVGGGKRLFEVGVKPQGFAMVDSKISTNGVVIASYEPAGMFKTGTVGE
jgi:dihydrofolate reductase